MPCKDSVSELRFDRSKLSANVVYCSGSTTIRLPSGQRVGFDHDPNSSADANRPASSTALFFRKVYYLASVRLLDLCERLRIDERGKQRVWTLFEHVLRTETSLMAGRHLDQNLMCCVYVVAKVFGSQNYSVLSETTSRGRVFCYSIAAYKSIVLYFVLPDQVRKNQYIPEFPVNTPPPGLCMLMYGKLTYFKKDN